MLNKLAAGTLKIVFPGDSTERKCNKKKLFSQFC